MGYSLVNLSFSVLPFVSIIASFSLLRSYLFDIFGYASVLTFMMLVHDLGFISERICFSLAFILPSLILLVNCGSFLLACRNILLAQTFQQPPHVLIYPHYHIFILTTSTALTNANAFSS